MSAYEDRKRAREEWLASLKAGDRVAIERGYRSDSYEMAQVERITPAGWFVVRSVEYENANSHVFGKDGAQRGQHGFQRAQIVPVTDEIMERLERRYFMSRVTYGTKWAELPIATVRAIVAILDAHDAAGKE